MASHCNPKNNNNNNDNNSNNNNNNNNITHEQSILLNVYSFMGNLGTD